GAVTGGSKRHVTAAAGRHEGGAMSLVGLDLNASRARAVIGAAGTVPKPLPLDEARRELPTALSLQNRHPEVGLAGAALSRQLPHLVCENFLSRLGTPQQWVAGRHRLDAARALTTVLERIHARTGIGKGVVLAVPAYLDGKQGQQIAGLATKAKLPFL